MQVFFPGANIIPISLYFHSDMIFGINKLLPEIWMCYSHLPDNRKNIYLGIYKLLNMKPIALLLTTILVSFNLSAKKTIFSGHFERTAASGISLQYTPDPIADIERHKTFVETELDENKSFRLEFDIEHPVMINVMNGKDWLFYNMFISPGDSIYMVFSDSMMEITGAGEKQLGFMFEHADKYLFDPVVTKEYNSSYVRLDPLDYAGFWEKRMNDQLDYFENYFKDTIVADDFKRAFEYEVQYDYGVHLVQYAWRRRKDHRFLFRTPGYIDYLDKIKVNNPGALISDRYIRFLRELPYAIWSSHLSQADEPDELSEYYLTHQVKIRDSIAKVYFAGPVYDMALYTILYEHLGNLNYSKGTPVFDSLATKMSTTLKEYGTGFSDDTLLERLERRLGDIKKSNQPAPDFTAYDMDGKEVKLSDYKGKVVYVDFWSTTCVPCVKELPATKKLQEQFKDNDGVVFLYVSFDNPEDLAKKFISDKGFTGVHWFSPKGLASEAAKKYNIHGIPRYILVDKNGLLVNDDAPRPSVHPESMIFEALRR